MSKLDGNERWKGKMLLTEHKEQYEERHRPKPGGRPDKEELTMIRDYIMLPHIIAMIQKCMEEMQFIRIALKAILMRCMEYMMVRVTDDYYKLKRELRERGIKVTETNTDDGIMFYRYSCRGYEDTFGIVRETLKAEIALRVTKYTEEIADKIRQ